MISLRLYYPAQERFWGRKEIDTRKLNYEYFWVDYEQAARRSNRWNPETQQYEGTVFNQQGEEVPIVNRSSFVLAMWSTSIPTPWSGSMIYLLI
jgi:formylglycine-generating enzyme